MTLTLHRDAVLIASGAAAGFALAVGLRFFLFEMVARDDDGDEDTPEEPGPVSLLALFCNPRTRHLDPLAFGQDMKLLMQSIPARELLIEPATTLHIAEQALVLARPRFLLFSGHTHRDALGFETVRGGIDKSDATHFVTLLESLNRPAPPSHEPAVDPACSSWMLPRQNSWRTVTAGAASAAGAAGAAGAAAASPARAGACSASVPLEPAELSAALSTLATPLEHRAAKLEEHLQKQRAAVRLPPIPTAHAPMPHDALRSSLHARSLARRVAGGSLHGSALARRRTMWTAIRN
jgi:hypothetical protein